jgi:D-sedoheptulose 7-phosphate isomerase
VTSFPGTPPDLIGVARTVANSITGGGLLLTYGALAHRADAHHLAVEFKHPAIVGKRAVPAIAIDVPADVALLGRPGDVALGLGPARGFLAAAARRGLTTVALDAPSRDDLIVRYHLLWELCHLVLENTAAVDDPDFAFLYGGLDDDAVADALRLAMAEKERDVAELRRCVLVEAEASGRLAGCAAAIAARVAAGGRILTFGNGGSATDADALALTMRRRGLPAASLADEPAVLTALANDVSFDVVFARQIASLAGPHDAVIGLSTSGGSPNVLAGFAEATSRGALTVGFAGYDGGRMADAGLDHLFVVPSPSVHRIQEAQTSLLLALTDAVATVGSLSTV